MSAEFAAKNRQKKVLVEFTQADWQLAGQTYTSPDIVCPMAAKIFFAMKSLTLPGNVTLRCQRKCEDGQYVDLTNLNYDSDNSRFVPQVSNVYIDSSLLAGAGQEYGGWDTGGTQTVRFIAAFSDATGVLFSAEVSSGF